MVSRILGRLGLSLVLTFALVAGSSYTIGYAADAPAPLLEKAGQPVDWWFAFKFNAKSFPSCAGTAKRACPFGGEVQEYKSFSQQYVFATSEEPLKKGKFCLGDTTRDPLGATFDQVYNGKHFYVLWNDQFYNDPDIAACKGSTFCKAPWAHSKGMLAWNEDGEGFVLQVTTPNWPGSGSKKFPREQNGNTLGCITKDGESAHNNVLVSQHFFALKLTKDDVLKVLAALQNAAVVTEHDSEAENRAQIVNNGGPADIKAKVDELGTLTHGKVARKDTLSSGVQVISKPAALKVPPWQMVSAVLGGVSLKVATWYSASKIPDTEANEVPECWDASLGKPGAVTNVETGHWEGTSFGLFGGSSPDRNHAKIGVSVTGNLAIFGDMNQEGALSGNCKTKQNDRGGLFFVVQDAATAKSLRSLLSDAP
jgi:hypothetical protein